MSRSQAPDHLPLHRTVPVGRRNLFSDKGRLAMSICGVAFSVLLILIVASLYRGWSESSRFFAALPGDLWVAQVGTADPFRSTSLLPASAGAELQAIPGVAAAIPVYARRVAFEHEGQAGDAFFVALALSGDAAIDSDIRERFFPEPGRLAIDRAIATDVGLSEGDKLEVLGRDFTITHVEPGGNPIYANIFMNGADGRAMLGPGANVNFFLIALSPGADLEAVAAQAAAVVPGAETHTSEEFADTTAELVEQGFLPVVGVLVGIGFLIGGAVIALTIYTATLERARDFGVLKALGASNRFVYRIVLRQSLFIGVVGSLLGLGASLLAVTVISDRVPEFVTELRVGDAAGVMGIALAVSLLAAAVPAARINRIDPAMVFRA